MHKFPSILGKYPATVLAVTLLVIIGLFAVFAQPFTANPSPTPTATPANLTIGTLAGTMNVQCDGSEQCDPQLIRSAYDMALYQKDASEPFARWSTDQTGKYSVDAPAGNYTLKTIPAIPGTEEQVTIKANSQSNVNLTITFHHGQ